jgi:hypothetical protein
MYAGFSKNSIFKKILSYGLIAIFNRVYNNWSLVLFFDDEIFIPTWVAVLEDQISLGMVLQMLLCRIDIGSFLMVAAKSFILVIFISVVTSSTMVLCALGSAVTSTRLFGYFSLSYCCWYSCRWWFTTSMVARVHVALSLRHKLKLWESLRWYFRFLVRYVSSAASRKVQYCVME